jgi:hypothetical protein
MFVHPVKYTYDPDAPPGAPGAPAAIEDDDDDDYEPPTAIHMSPYRGDAGGPDGFGQIQRSPAAPQVPSATPAPVIPKAPVPAAGAPAKPPPYLPPGVHNEPQPQPPPQPARPAVDPRMLETQQLSSAQPPAQFIPGQTGSGLMTPTGTPMATFVDPDAAPVWLKALALSSVVSAITVLGVLGWMLSGRF